nr:serine hydrolase domain-containing protein [Sphingomonas sp. Y57]
MTIGSNLSDAALADRVDRVMEAALAETRAPGAAVAVVIDGALRFARGYGLRAAGGTAPVDAATAYPIASTTKAINATLLGMLVDEGRLDFDARLRGYLPDVRFADPVATDHATLRDLITMRTGLPRHDWLWKGYPASRGELASRLAWLEPSCAFRERFQYNNLTTTLAGHAAERVIGESWDRMVATRILEPLGMSATSFTRPQAENVTDCHHENADRAIVTTRLLSTAATAPSGGAIWSTVEDMARWAAFNLDAGWVGGRRLIDGNILADIHRPQIEMGADSTAPSPTAAYALGWCVDQHAGRRRVSHGGYLHDVSSDVTLFPDERLAIVSFLNFGCVLPARVVNEQIADRLFGRASPPLADHRRAYEAKVDDRARANLAGVGAGIGMGDKARGCISIYAGAYQHPGYGDVELHPDADGKGLLFHRGDLRERLEPARDGSWRFAPSDRYPIHLVHPFERSNRVMLAADETGAERALSLRLEPSLPPIRFVRKD